MSLSFSHRNRAQHPPSRELESMMDAVPTHKRITRADVVAGVLGGLAAAGAIFLLLSAVGSF